MPVKCAEKGSYLRGLLIPVLKPSGWKHPGEERVHLIYTSSHNQSLRKVRAGNQVKQSEIQLASSLPGSCSDSFNRSAHLPRDGVPIVLRPSASRKPLTDITSDKGGLGSPLLETHMTQD